ncbi:hypothetical protein ACLB2K_045646 [Fragaria x ananassa]
MCYCRVDRRCATAVSTRDVLLPCRKDKTDAKRVAAKAASKVAGRGPPTRGRPPKAATSTIRNVYANTQPSQASSRSSMRI